MANNKKYVDEINPHGVSRWIEVDLTDSTRCVLSIFVVLPWTEEDLKVAQLMIWHHEKWLTPVLKSFMDTTRDILKTDF